MFRTILVPIDGSPASESALSIASSLSGLAKGRLIGLFVEDQRRFFRVALTPAILNELGLQPYSEAPLAMGELMRESENVERETEALYRDFLARCKKADVEGEFLTNRGTPEETIIQAAYMADLIVLGSKGRHSGVPQAHAGDTVKNVLRKCAIPSLVVPENPRGEALITVAYDETFHSQRALRVAASLAETIRMDVDLLTVSNKSEEIDSIQTPALEYLSNFDITVRASSRSGKAAEEILAHVKETDASILAIGAAFHLSDMLFGSICSAALDQDQTAVLFVP